MSDKVNRTGTDIEKPFNNLPYLPPAREKIETLEILRRLVPSAVALAELKGLANTLPNPNILLNAVILKEARASSEIENVITTQDKLYQALSTKGIQADAATKEVLRYREAMLLGYDIIQKKDFYIPTPSYKFKKCWRKTTRAFANCLAQLYAMLRPGKLFIPPDSYETILGLMKNFETYLNEPNELSPLIKLAVQHYQFESINPFYDGNGRTGRMINVLYLILHDLLQSPILYLSAYIINTKTDYYRLLQEVRLQGAWENWVLYILKGIEQTANETIKQIQQINKLFTKTGEKIKDAAPKSYNKELLEIVFEHPYCKIEYLTERLHISRITASKYLKELEALGILNSKQVWKEILFVNTELFRLLKN